MKMSADKPDFEDNVPTEQHLKELLTTAIELDANISEIEQERNKASEQLDAVWSRIHQAIVNEAELKRKRATIQQLNNDFSIQVHRQKEEESFMDQFKALQNAMGITIVCKPELKTTEITFDDALKTKVSFLYDIKGITLGEMYPAHPNVDAIRTQLSETGDLLGFLSTLRKKLTLQNV
uniref:Kinetochore protein SPC25 n=1 Tax=Anopheles coluzzii TaxID=1518534 RepID=A0A8W7Q4R5_ANOCL